MTRERERPVTFEYRYECFNPTIENNNGSTDRRLTRHGSQGWELVSCVSQGANYIGFFFKRPVPANQVRD